MKNFDLKVDSLLFRVEIEGYLIDAFNVYPFNPVLLLTITIVAF